MHRRAGGYGHWENPREQAAWSQCWAGGSDHVLVSFAQVPGSWKNSEMFAQQDVAGSGRVNGDREREKDS